MVDKAANPPEKKDGGDKRFENNENGDRRLGADFGKSSLADIRAVGKQPTSNAEDFLPGFEISHGESGTEQPGYGAVAKEIAAGALDEITNHPFKVAAEVAVGAVAAVGLAYTSPVWATGLAVAGVAAGGAYLGYTLYNNFGNWVSSAEAVAGGHATDENREALRGLGRGGTDLVAGAIGGGVGGLGVKLGRTAFGGLAGSLESGSAGGSTGALDSTVINNSLEGALKGAEGALDTGARLIANVVDWAPKKFIAGMQEGLDALPPQINEALANSGVKIYVGTALRDAHSFANKLENLADQNLNLDKWSEGIFLPGLKRVLLETQHAASDGSIKTFSNSAYALLHELGHAFSFGFRREAGASALEARAAAKSPFEKYAAEQFADNPQFRAAHASDVARLKSSLSEADFKKLDYYHKDLAPDRLQAYRDHAAELGLNPIAARVYVRAAAQNYARGEVFAESFAQRFGAKTEHNFEKLFPESYALTQARINSFLATCR